MEDGNVLMQMITPDIKANEWGGTPEPTTNFGDDRWYNYSVSADVKLEKSENPASNYAGIGLRYNLGCLGASGYRFQLWEDGTWELLKNGNELESGSASADASAWVNLKISADRNVITTFINDEQVCSYTVSNATLIGAGRAALYSSYNRSCFDNIKVVSGSEVIEIGTAAIRLTSLFYIFLGTIHITRGFLNGSGDTGYAVINGIVEVVSRIGFSLILTAVPFIGYRGIWITTCVTWVITAVISVVRYKNKRWEKKSVV